METQLTVTGTTAGKIFDRKFVFAALIIGIAYATIVVLLGTLMGKEAAGVAGVALTALAGAIFKQFETLRFRSLALNEETTVYISKISWWYLTLFVFANLGTQTVFGLVFGEILSVFGYMPNLNANESFGGLLTDPKILIGLVGITLLAHIFSGFICGKTAPTLQYSYALLACFASLLIPIVMIVVAQSVRNLSLKMFLEPAIYTTGIYWLVYLAGSFFGARVGFKNRVFTPKA
jgi:hypothetical protein